MSPPSIRRCLTFKKKQTQTSFIPSSDINKPGRFGQPLIGAWRLVERYVRQSSPLMIAPWPLTPDVLGA